MPIFAHDIGNDLRVTLVALVASHLPLPYALSKMIARRFPTMDFGGPPLDQTEAGWVSVRREVVTSVVAAHDYAHVMSEYLPPPFGTCCLVHADAWILGDHQSTRSGASGPFHEDWQPQPLSVQPVEPPFPSFRFHV